MNDHGYTLLDFLPDETVYQGVEDRDLEKYESFLYGLSSSDVVLLEYFVPQASWTDLREEPIEVLSTAASSLLEPHKRAAESGSEALLESGKTRQCFAMTISFYCDTPKAKNISAGRHD